jgi:hypothetical protein
VYVPRFWTKTKKEIDTEDGKRLLVAWGFGDDEEKARAEAGRRLQRLTQRVSGAGQEPSEYDYGDRPLREEILQVLGPDAVLTRNRHGAVVLNAARLLFLDLDRPPASGLGLLGRLFGKKDPEAAAIERVRASLREAAPAVTFRLYRTAAGMRAIAVDREFDPAGAEAQALMQRTMTDPAFMRLCLVQKSFRARLTPKHWRCGCPDPPGEHPRVDEGEKRAFAAWCKGYERAIEGRATCRYLETVGNGNTLAKLAPVIQVHDQATRCSERLPLA